MMRRGKAWPGSRWLCMAPPPSLFSSSPSSAGPSSFVVSLPVLYAPHCSLHTVLDSLAAALAAHPHGQPILFLLILLTTIRQSFHCLRSSAHLSTAPLPLYSTLILLSGYTYGPWVGALISYFAALSGAILVFTLSRSFLHTSITSWLNAYPPIKRVVRAIECRPKLLFLIRLAPYPYNVMNCLLAAAPSLSLHTYTVCTALSLFKVIIHTTIGASIHSFSDYHQDHTLPKIWTAAGILLSIAILIYLSVIARRAVDNQLHNDDDDLEHAPPMAESPFRSHHPALIPLEPEAQS